MKEIAKIQFRRDFIIKTLVQKSQFEQWLKFTFYINDQLSKKEDVLYQDIFYVKLYETLTEGLHYAEKIYSHLINTADIEKIQWYSILIDGLTRIKQILNESEFNYIEYRRHCASHIFQNQYEHIQDNLKIKTVRKDKNLIDIIKQIESLIILHKNERNIDKYLNKKLHPELFNLYNSLQITKQNK